MGQKGRFGKYGETKRLDRLRRAGPGISLRPASGPAPPKGGVSGERDRSGKARVKIRRARSSDADYVGHLAGKVFGIYGPYRETVLRWFISGEAINLILSGNRNPVGFVMFSRPPADPAPQGPSELLAIALEPEWQGLGLGRRLLEEAEKEAALHRVHQMFLHTAVENTQARRLFLASGYCPVVVKARFYPAGQDALLMVKDLFPLP